MRYLPVNKEKIPYSNILFVDGKSFKLEFNYNSLFDFFTVDLSLNDVSIVTGEKIILNMPLFATINYPFEMLYLIPMDLSKTADRITFNNFNDTIFIYSFER